MNKNTLEVDSNIKAIITQCISDAVGDKIKEDIRLHGLKTQNSTPTRIWDLLNTDLCRHFNGPDCMAYTSKRGPWEMILVYEKQSGFLYTFMREKRFSEIRAKVGKRRRMHYVDMLVRHLNPDLKAPIGQTSMFPIHFDDEAQLAESVQALLVNLLEDGAVVRRHVLVLFESSRFILTSVRAVMVYTNLDIVAEKNWSSSISVEESVIAEQVEEPKNPANAPTRGLKLTAKAAARKESNPLRPVDEKSEAK